MAINDDKAVTNEDTPVSTNVLVNDTGPNGEVPRLDSIVTAPENGTATVNAGEGTISYSPRENFNGTDSLVYRAIDGTGEAGTGTLAISVRAVNDPPVSLNDTVSTPEDTAISIAVLANDTDADGDTLRISGVAGAQNGTARVAMARSLTCPTRTGPAARRSTTRSATATAAPRRRSSSSK